MYSSGVANDNFAYNVMSGYCNGGKVSSKCPFAANTGLNADLQGEQIFEIKNNNNGKCVGTNASGGADMGPCPPTNGTGTGSNLWVAINDVGCEFPSAYYANIYWTNHHDNSILYTLLSGGSVGAQAHIYNDEYGSCWKAVNQ
jgi:hypothetical protein